MHVVREWMRGKRLDLAHHRPGSSQASHAGGPAAIAPMDLTGTHPVLRPTILMVMLDRCTIDHTVQGLADAGYEMRVVQDLPCALEALRDGKPALVLVLVCGLPAPDICEALRRASIVPILALLTQVTEADTLHVLLAGADDCQPASIGKLEVLRRVRTLLARGAHQRSLST